MAFNKDPQQYLPGISVIDGDLVIPLAVLPELSEDEVEGSGDSADIRRIMFALMSALWDAWPKVYEDQPERTKFYASVSTDTILDIDTRSYTLTFDTQSEGVEVMDED